MTAEQADKYLDDGGKITNVNLGFIFHKDNGVIYSEVKCPFIGILELYPDGWVVVETTAQQWWNSQQWIEQFRLRSLYFQNNPMEEELKPCEIEYIYNACIEKIEDKTTFL